MSVTEIVSKHYNSRNEDERFEKRSSKIEFIITKKYIDIYLKSTDKILEIGAGTGRYSLYFADKGYDVSAVELIEKNINVLRGKIAPHHIINVAQGNATDLSLYKDNSFDITLLLGPMYHLFDTNDKLKALQESIRVTKKSGFIFVAYTQFDAAMIQTAFIKGMFNSLVDMNLLDDKSYLPINNEKGVFELYRKEDINELNKCFDVKRLHYIGTDMFAEYYKDELEKFSDEIYDKFIEYTLTICENQNIVGISNHSLDVLVKN